VPPLRITTPELGGPSFLNWSGIPSGVQPVINLADTIFPVQEQFRFQERWFYLFESVQVPQADRVLWQWAIPQGESWNIDMLAFVHTDSVAVDVRVRIVAAAGIDGISDIINKEFEPGFETLLYPSRSLQNNVATSIGQEFAGDELILLPQETLEIVTSTATQAGFTTMKMAGRYRLRPIPITAPILSPVIPVTTIV